MEALAASGATLLIVAGYALIKRFRRSRCHTDSGCMECESPADELQKQQSERLDAIFELLKKTEPEGPGFRADLSPEKGEDVLATTTVTLKVDDS